MHRSRFHLLFSFVSFALLFSTNVISHASGPQPGPISIVSLNITSVNPAQPLEGNKATITYSVTLIGAPKQITGSVVGSFQGSALQQPNGGSAPVITLQPRISITGTLVTPILKASSGTVTLELSPPSPSGCTGLIVNIARCRTIPIATATLQVNVIEPTVVVRIAGSTYANIHEPDSQDSASANNGYECVVHNPGCGWWGNSGTDKFFNKQALPAGATLVGTDFVQYWPLGLDSGNQGAWTWLNSSGSYYAHLDTGTPSQPAVKWNNTCWGPFSGKNLNYSISFLISMPKGTNLGEPTSDPTSKLSSPCLPSGYSPNPVGAPPPSITPVPLYLVTMGSYFSGQFGLSTSPGKIQSIKNGENFQIVLLKSGNFPGQCASPGNVLLAPNQTISGAALVGLYGSTTPSYPRTIQACAVDTTLAATQQSVEVVITYVPTTP